MEDAEEGHEGGVDDDFAKKRSYMSVKFRS